MRCVPQNGYIRFRSYYLYTIIKAVLPILSTISGLMDVKSRAVFNLLFADKSKNCHILKDKCKFNFLPERDMIVFSEL